MIVQGRGLRRTSADTLEDPPTRKRHAVSDVHYKGSTAFAMRAMFLAVSGDATFATGVLPRWTGWVVHVGAVLCVACVPAMYFGPVDYAGFYNAGGWGPGISTTFPPVIWFLVASISMIRKRESVASHV